MVSVVKSEWHQLEKRYGIEIDASLLSEIYPELDEDEIEAKLAALESGEEDVEEVLNEAWNNGVDIDWDWLNEDDLWTDRKGGYEVTYKVEEWEVREDYVAPITHKCPHCKWTGSKYDAQWSWEDSDGNEFDEAVKICPMCDSVLELTEVGVEEEAKDAANKAKWARESEVDEADFDEANDEEPVSESEHWPTSNSDFVETAKWPFEDELDKEMKEELKGIGNALDALDAEMPGDVLPNYPAGEYTIRVWGRTREIGVGKISKQQYEHWSHEDHEDDLDDALNENYDYEENNTPKKAQFDAPYYEYQDVKSIWGFDEDDTIMTIENSDGEVIYSGDVVGFLQESYSDNDYDEASEEVDELYPHYLGKGYFVVWTQGGKGSCIQTTIDTEGEEFDPRKFKIKTYDIEGTSIISRLVYDGSELEDEGMDSEHDNWRGQWSQFDIYHNKK